MPLARMVEFNENPERATPVQCPIRIVPPSKDLIPYDHTGLPRRKPAPLSKEHQQLLLQAKKVLPQVVLSTRVLLMSSGLELEDAVQHILIVLAGRLQGPHPYDPTTGPFRNYLGILSKTVLQNQVSKRARRLRSHEAIAPIEGQRGYEIDEESLCPHQPEPIGGFVHRPKRVKITSQEEAWRCLKGREQSLSAEHPYQGLGPFIASLERYDLTVPPGHRAAYWVSPDDKARLLQDLKKAGRKPKVHKRAKPDQIQRLVSFANVIIFAGGLEFATSHFFSIATE